MRQLLKMLALMVVCFLFSCSDRSNRDHGPTESMEQKPVADEGSRTGIAANLNAEIDTFVTDSLLGGITLGKLYEVESLKKTFGQYIEKSQESAKVDYEGMKGDHLNKYKYPNFDLVFYVVENNREILAYLELHENVESPVGKVGDSIESVKARAGDQLQRLSGTYYTINVAGRNALSGVTILTKNDRVDRVRVNLGEI